MQLHPDPSEPKVDGHVNRCSAGAQKGEYPVRLLRGPATRRAMRLFRGSCGLTPRPRCQPGSGATRSEPVFPTKREGPARGRRRHAVAVEALVPPGAARVAIRIATRVATVYTNAPKRPRGAISIDLCTLLRPYGCSQQRNSPTVYTNAPIRRGKARSSHLCTLLRSQGYPQPKPTAQ